MKIGLYLIFALAILTRENLCSQTNVPGGGGQGQAALNIHSDMPAVNQGSSYGSPSGPISPDSGLDGVTWDGKSFKVTDLRVLDSKFSAYLNEPEISVAEEKEYAALIEQINELLDVYKIRGKNRDYLVREVMPLLKKASRYPRDGGLCRSIYTATGTDLQAKDASASKKEKMKELEKKIDALKWNMQVTAQTGTLAPEGSRGAQDDEARRSVKYAFLSDELQNTYSQMQALAEQDLEKAGDARLALQRLVVMAFLGRRFDHVLIGSAIYRLMYSDGAGEVKVQQRLIKEAAENAKQLRAAANISTSESTKNAQSTSSSLSSTSKYSSSERSITRAESGISSMLPSTTAIMDSVTGAKLQIAAAIPETMTEIEMVSQETIDQCNRYLSAVKGHLAQNEIDNAYQRLQEAFAAGENLACVRSFPREYKQTLWKYKNALKEAKSGLASKDLGKAKESIDKINQMTSDNPLSKESSEIGNVETISSMHLAKAKEAASRGDRESMNKELEEAAKVWPQNPALASATSKIVDQLDQQSQNKTELRKLIEQKNYKYIFDEKARFLASAVDDKSLLASLNNALKDYGATLEFVGKAEEYDKRGDPFGAWETADEGLKSHPDNTELLKIKTAMAMKVPEFAMQIERGRSAAQKGDSVAALCAYLAARRYYPNSLLAKEGIENQATEAMAH